MGAERRSRSQWQQLVRRWKKSGLTADEFAAAEGVSERTLRWWTSTLRRDTRAMRGRVERRAGPIEIEVARAEVAPRQVEITIGSAVVRVEVGADVDYVAGLVRRLGADR